LSNSVIIMVTSCRDVFNFIMFPWTPIPYFAIIWWKGQNILKINCLHVVSSKKKGGGGNLNFRNIDTFQYILNMTMPYTIRSHSILYVRQRKVRVRVMVLNATVNNISVILLRSVLLMEETRVPGDLFRIMNIKGINRCVVYICKQGRYYISVYQVQVRLPYLSPLNRYSIIDILDCQWLVTGRWVSPGTLVSSINKTDRNNITEILLTVALSTITICVHFSLNKNINCALWCKTIPNNQHRVVRDDYFWHV
jgi:hypothetical protein